MYTVKWAADAAAGTITFTMRAATTGWLAVGFALGGGAPHRDTDMYVGWVSEGAATVQDLWSASLGPPPVADAADDVTDVSGTEADGATEITFTRKLTTDDASQDVDLSGGAVLLQWPFHETSDDPNTIHSSRGSTVVRMSATRRFVLAQARCLTMGLLLHPARPRPPPPRLQHRALARARARARGRARAAARAGASHCEGASARRLGGAGDGRRGRGSPRAVGRGAAPELRVPLRGETSAER